MRGGVLLAEEAPLQLMEKSNCSDLEEAFLVLSHKQEAQPKAVVRVQTIIMLLWIRVLKVLSFFSTNSHHVLTRN